MSKVAKASKGQERAIAGLLRYGTWLASSLICVGLAANELHVLAQFAPLDLTGAGLIKSGIALMILLPISRVALMFFLFAREQDVAYMAISALVMAIIAASFLISL